MVRLGSRLRRSTPAEGEVSRNTFGIVLRFKVLSCANGTFRIEPVYKRKYQRPGLMTRLYLAEQIQRLLNQRVTK